MDDITPQPNKGDQKLPLSRKVIILGLIIIFAIAVGAYFFLKKKTHVVENPTFPISNDLGSPNGDISKEDKTPTTNTPEDTERLYRKIYDGPLVGYRVMGDGINIRGFDAAKGLIVSINSITGTSRTVTDTPILYVHDATFPDGESMIIRTLDASGNIKARLYTLTEDNEGLITLGKPTQLADNIMELSVSQNEKYIILVVRNDDGGAHIDTIELPSRKITTAANLHLSEWIPHITNKGKIYLSSKASRYAKSSIYALSEGRLEMLIPSRIALTSLPSFNGDYIYTSELSAELTAFARSRVGEDLDADEREIQLNTIADKCSWTKENKLFCGINRNPSSVQIDEWYLGTQLGNDYIAGYDATSTISEIIPLDKELTVRLDIVNVKEIGVYVCFINRYDDSLWVAKKPSFIKPTTPEISNSENNAE